MKIALVTDTHFGGRNDSLPFDAFFKRFYDECFFPELEKRGIDTIMHLGDIFDRRKYINYNSLKSCKEYFFDKARDLGMQVLVIPGNHDTYYKNTNAVNSPSLLLKEYENISIFEEPTEIDGGDGNLILFVPWINNENYQATMDKVNSTSAKYCFGHFEFSGYVMYRGMPNAHGMDPGLFDKFDVVLSGHFHHRHSRANITYIGNPYEMTWSDFEDDRGFAIFETEDGSIEFVNNPNRMFHKLYYDDSEDVAIDYDALTGTCVKLVVAKKSDYAKFDQVVDKLYACDLIELKILEDFSEFEEEALGDDVDLEDTMTLLDGYIESINTDLNKEKLKSVVRTLYVEAQHHDA